MADATPAHYLERPARTTWSSAEVAVARHTGPHPLGYLERVMTRSAWPQFSASER